MSCTDYIRKGPVFKFERTESLDFYFPWLFKEQIPIRFAERVVPRLIVQPVLENAFIYGLKNKKASGLLKLSYQATGSQLAILVEDNGEEITDDGIMELRRKLEMQENQEKA